MSKKSEISKFKKTTQSTFRSPVSRKIYRLRHGIAFLLFFIFQAAFAQAPLLNVSLIPGSVTIVGTQTGQVNVAYVFPNGFQIANRLIGPTTPGLERGACRTNLLGIYEGPDPFGSPNQTLTITGCGPSGQVTFVVGGLAKRIGVNCPTRPIAPGGVLEIADNINCFDFPTKILQITFQSAGLASTTTTRIINDLPDPSNINQAYSVGVSVTSSGGTPNGNVIINDGSGATCIATLNNGLGACQLTSTSAGSKTLTANFAGNASFLASSGTEPHVVVVTGKPIVGNLSGSWWNPNRSGEGFFIDVSNVSGRKVLVASWFTYLAGKQQYLVGSADVAPGASSIDLSMISTDGTGFGNQFLASQVRRIPWGTVRLEFVSCNEMRVIYNGNGQSGSLTQQRLIGPLSDVGCE